MIRHHRAHTQAEGRHRTQGISPRETSDAYMKPWRGVDLAAPGREVGRRQALGEAVTGSSSPWTPAAEARGGNQRLALHAPPSPVMRRRENLPARAPPAGRVRHLASPSRRCVLRRIKAALRVRVWREGNGTETRVWRRRVEENGLRTFGTGFYYEPVLKVPFSTGS
jgi:hypothetical protein